MKKIAFLTILVTSLLTSSCNAQHSDQAQAATSDFSVSQRSQTRPAPIELVDFSDVAAATIDAVVHIKTEMTQLTPLYQSFFGFIIQQGMQRQTYQAYGSGVIITADGYILTNNHVVQDAESISVTLNDRRELPARLIGNDPATDLAVIKIEADGLTFIPFGNSDMARVGEPVLAIGNPFNLTSTVTSGIISAKARNMHIIDNPRTSETPLESFIQTDAAVNSGNSGGALVNSQAELIGIVTAIASGNSGNYIGYSFAIPSNIAIKVAGDLKNYGYVQRGYLGVQVTEVDANVARKAGVRSIKGLYVAKVTEDCAAARAGIHQGDIILRVADKEVNTFAEMMEELALFSPGDEVTVEIERQGNTKTVRATLLNSQGTTKIMRGGE
ncbi:MAG: trypsin-like peptidase domain-containing protein [Bacteroidales bacterium]|nr:trypsin-like peptidase domain-containing protein [Bacteroidales bacterium]